MQKQTFLVPLGGKRSKSKDTQKCLLLLGALFTNVYPIVKVVQLGEWKLSSIIWVQKEEQY